MSDADPEVHERSNTPASDADGMPNGAALGTPKADLGQPSPAASVAPQRVPERRDDGLPTAGVPDAATAEQWCKGCNAMVLPIGKGRCPRCHKFLRLNFTARRHPTNILRRDQLLADIVRDFPPRNSVERFDCERLAAAQEQSEGMRIGTLEWQRTSTTITELRTVLNERTSADAEAPRGLATTPMSALQLADALMKRKQAGDQLSERELVRLELLQESIHGTLLLPPDPEPVVHVVKTQYEASTPAAPPPAPTPAESEALNHASTVAQSKKAAERDSQLKIENFDVWCVLHETDPEVIELVRQRRHKEMMMTLPYGVRLRW